MEKRIVRWAGVSTSPSAATAPTPVLESASTPKLHTSVYGESEVGLIWWRNLKISIKLTSFFVSAAQQDEFILNLFYYFERKIELEHLIYIFLTSKKTLFTSIKNKIKFSLYIIYFWVKKCYLENKNFKVYYLGFANSRIHLQINIMF